MRKSNRGFAARELHLPSNVELIIVQKADYLCPQVRVSAHVFSREQFDPHLTHILPTERRNTKVRSLLRLALIASQLLISASTVVAQKEIWKLPNKKAPSARESTRRKEPLAMESWRTPSVACSLLDDTGLHAQGWKNQATAATVALEPWNRLDYRCSSAYTPLNAEIPMRDGSIAYYVDGSEQSVSQLKLVLSIHDRRFVELGNLSLAVISHALTLRALDKPLPLEIVAAMRKAEPGRWKIGLNEIEVQREDYVNGSGYDLKFLIR